MRSLLSIGLVMAVGAAQAATIVIDNFDNTNFFQILNSATPTYNRVDSPVGDLAASRRLIGSIDPVSGSALQAQLQSGGGNLILQSAEDTRSLLDLSYTFGATDFTQTPIFRFHFLINNADLDFFGFTLTDSNNVVASFTGPVSGSLVPFVHSVAFSQMTAGAGFDLSSVVNLRANFETQMGHDFTLSRIDAVPEPFTMALAAGGLLAAARARRRRSAKA
jgi:hypothetical protein